jgi:hypothetical protein
MRLGLRRQLTGRQLRAHFTVCPDRLDASDQADRRGEAREDPRTHDRECCAAGAAERDSRQWSGTGMQSREA